MADSSEYTLGIDCFPEGIFAALASEGRVTTIFAVEHDNEPIRSITERTIKAIQQAATWAGKNPQQIVLACIDDGGDGTETQELKDNFGCLIETQSFVSCLNEYEQKIKETINPDNAALSAIRASRTAAAHFERSSLNDYSLDPV